MDKNALCQSDCSIFTKMKSQEQINQIAWFFAYWYQFKKIKFSSMFWVGMVKNASSQSGYETLKFSITQEWALEINWFLHDATNSGKLKVSSMIFG